LAGLGLRLCSASAVLIACFGFTGCSITLFAFYLFIRDRHDPNTRAAGTVAAAAATQAVWAPLVFSKISFLLLPIDAGIVGSLVGQIVPDASWSGTVVTTPSGHNVEITAACASFHNLSLALLCLVTLTMLHRPYWVKAGRPLCRLGRCAHSIRVECLAPCIRLPKLAHVRILA
jgi:hypothetical protein